MDPQKSDRPFAEYTKSSSSAAGCFIFLTIAAVVIFLIAWGIYTFVKQNAAIDEFTVADPITLEFTLPDPATTATLHARLREFSAVPPSPLVLSAADLNNIVTTEPRLENLRGMLRFDSIGDGLVHASISFPLRSLGTSGFRYLNGAMTFLPNVVDGQFIMDLKSITVPDREVATGFISNYRHSRYLENLFFRPFEEDKKLWPVIASVTTAKIEGDKIILERTPGAGIP